MLSIAVSAVSGQTTPTYLITTAAGAAYPPEVGDGGPAINALVSGTSIALDPSGNLYIAIGSRIRKVTPDGIIQTIAGIWESGHSGDGGPARLARINAGFIAIDGMGNLYFTEPVTHHVRKILPDGTIETIAGTGERGFSGDGGPAIEASFAGPSRIAADPAGNLFVEDTGNFRIRKITPDGTVTTVAGGGQPNQGLAEGRPATSVTTVFPTGLAVDAAGRLHFSANDAVYQITGEGSLIRVAVLGGGFGGDGGPARNAELRGPRGLVFDRQGNLYIVDSLNWRVRKVTPAGLIATIAGRGAPGSRGDGGPALEAEMSADSVAVDGAGAVYVGGPNAIRRVGPSGLIVTVAGAVRYR